MIGGSPSGSIRGVGADLFGCCVCRDFVQQEDLTKAARKVAEAKKHESTSHPFPLPFFSFSGHGLTPLFSEFTAKLEFTA